MIEAQYEVLGQHSLRTIRPVRDGRMDRTFPSIRSYGERMFDRPCRDGYLFAIISQHFVLGYFHRIPPGRLLSTHISSRYVDARARLYWPYGPAERFAKLMLMRGDPIVES